MIQIYNVDNTNFDYNGDAVLWPDACKLDVILNSAWELALSHPIDDEGRYRYLVENAVIKVPSFNGEQLFRIYDKEITDTSVTVNARPIFMDSADEVFLIDTRPTGKNGQQALDIMTAGTKYSGRSDIAKADTTYYIRKNLIEALNSDDEQSFLNRWGGEIVFDNYTVIINGRAGGDYGVSVEYGKNLTAIDEAVNMEEVCTRIVPVAYNGYTLEGSRPWVDSPNIGKYPKIFTRVVTFDDVKLTEDAQEDEESFDTLAALRTELIRRANLMFTEDKVDTPAVSLEVGMALLQNTEEYKNYKVLEDVSLGDTVRCVHSQYKIESEARVVGLIYDCIEDKVESVTLGKFQKNYFDDLTSTFDRVESTIRPNGTIMAERVQGILNGIYTQLRLQSTAAKKVEGRAFMVEDTDPESDLYGCMIWGTQGLQIAVQKTADGRDWDFTTAITARGIVADAIITGILSDKQGRNYWNLDTGEFQLSAEAFKVDEQTVQDYVDGKIDEKVAEIRSLTLILSNEFQGIATDENGNNGYYEGCSTDVMLFIGTIDITSSSVVNYTINPAAGVIGSWNAANKRYTVTNMTVDNGFVDITASYLNLTITRRFTISKVRAGRNGLDGVPGQPGKDGKTAYFHVKYASTGSPTAAQMSETPNVYIGTYVDFVQSDSDDPAKYTWAKFQGTDGIPGKNGENGETSYLHIKYSNDGGLTFTANNGEEAGEYIGQYVDFNKADSSNPSDYKWTLVKGEDGRVYFIQPNVTVLKQGANGAFIPDSIVFNAYYRDGKTAVNTPYSGRWIVQESTNGSTFTTSYAPGYNTSSIMVAPSRSDIKIIRATLYAVGGTTDALDIQSVTVVRDIDNLTQEEVFNILTNNGQTQGIYMQDGRLYLNGQYMQMGKIADKTGKSYWDLDNGEVVFDGGIINGYHSNGNIGYRLGEGTINFYSRNDPNNVVGAIGTDRERSVGQVQALVLSADDGDALSFGVGQTNYAEYLQMYNGETFIKKNLRFEGAEIRGDVTFNFGMDGNAYFWNGVAGGGGNTLVLKSNVRIYCRQIANPAVWIPISAASFDVNSKQEAKKDIKKFERAIELLKNINIYEYKLKIDADDKPNRIGLVIGDDYEVPDNLISDDGDSIDLYSLASLAIASAKELYSEVETLKNNLKEKQHASR